MNVQVDVAYVPFIERFQLILRDVMNMDITSGRPNLALWIQVKPLLWLLYLFFHMKTYMLICGSSPFWAGDEQDRSLHRNPTRSTRASWKIQETSPSRSTSLSRWVSGCSSFTRVQKSQTNRDIIVTKILYFVKELLVPLFYLFFNYRVE